MVLCIESRKMQFKDESFVSSFKANVIEYFKGEWCQSFIQANISRGQADLSRIFDGLELSTDSQVMEEHIESGKTLQEFFEPLIDEAKDTLLHPQQIALSSSVIKAIGTDNYEALLHSIETSKAKYDKPFDRTQVEAEIANSVLTGVLNKYSGALKAPEPVAVNGLLDQLSEAKQNITQQIRTAKRKELTGGLANKIKKPDSDKTNDRINAYLRQLDKSPNTRSTSLDEISLSVQKITQDIQEKPKMNPNELENTYIKIIQLTRAAQNLREPFQEEAQKLGGYAMEINRIAQSIASSSSDTKVDEYAWEKENDPLEDIEFKVEEEPHTKDPTSEYKKALKEEKDKGKEEDVDNSSDYKFEP